MKSALITGAASGIGKACAQRMAKEGYGVVVADVNMAAAEALAWPLARLFVGYDPELTRLTAEGFRIFGLCFFFMGYAIFSSGFFTALNDGVTSAIISFLRTLVFQVAAVLLLSSLWGITGIWISIIVAEFMAVLLSALFLMIKRIKYHYWAG